MKEIIDQLTEKVGLTPEQAQKAIETIAEYVKDKFPMLGGAVDQIFSSKSDNSGESGLGGFGL